MGRIWSAENRFRKWLEVELAVLEGWAELGVVPRAAVAAVRERARVDLDRIAALEREVHHDVIAFITSVAEQVGEWGRYVHHGLTSNDVVDTAQALLLKEAGAELAAAARRLADVLAERAREHRHTVMMGRTHGVHAEPITFGLKLAVWWAEMGRNVERLERATRAVAVGKISGSVGTYANVPPSVEEHACRLLGLEPEPVSNQVVQRDRHAEFLTTLAVVGGSLEKFATEVRGLQRTEVREAEEPFRAGQKGSSSMPHKRNPEKCERVCGLARLLRGYAVSALESQALWHERDISHSSVERVVLPDATTLLHYMLVLMAEIVSDLRVYPARMRANLELTGGLVFSQKVMLALVEKGMAREEAYRIVQGHSLAAWEAGLAGAFAGGAPGGGGGAAEAGAGAPSFRERVAADPAVRAVLTEEELAACFDPAAHLRHVDEIFARLGLG